MEADLTIRNAQCICVFTIRDLTCMLMACAHTYKDMMEGNLDDNEGFQFQMLSPDQRQDMTNHIGGLRSEIVNMIFKAIGDDNANACMAFVEQQMMARDGIKPN